MGSHTLLKLKDKPGVEVKAAYHKQPPHIFGTNIEYVQADLLNRDACPPLMEGIDYVLMFAGILSTAPVIARDPIAPIMTNLLITSQSLEAAYYAGVNKFVWLSSTTGYPDTEGELVEEDMFQGDPPNVYYPVGWMTRYIETLCRMYSEMLSPKMTAIALRPTLIYGGFDDFEFESAHFLPAMIRRVVERQNPIEVWGTGEQTRDLIYAGDVVDATFRAVDRIDRFEAFNIASGISYSVNETLQQIIEIDDFYDANIVHLTSKPTTVSTRSLVAKKAKDILGFQASTSLAEGIRKTIGWYREIGCKEVTSTDEMATEAAETFDSNGSE